MRFFAFVTLFVLPALLSLTLLCALMKGVTSQCDPTQQFCCDSTMPGSELDDAATVFQNPDAAKNGTVGLFCTQLVDGACPYAWYLLVCLNC